MGINGKVLILLMLLLITHTLIGSAQQGILIYHVYYNDILIIQLEVVPGNIVNVKIIPLYSIDARSYYAISDLIVSPTKYRFILSDVEAFARDVNALMKYEGQSVIIEYKVGKFTRVSVYDSKTGILLYETNTYDDINISIIMVTIIGGDVYYNTITVTTPLAIFILGLAAYSYIKKEEIRIL